MSAFFHRQASRSLFRGACIIALPLTDSNPSTSSNQRRLTYYHFQTSLSEADAERTGWVHQAMSKAKDAWAAMGRAEDEFDENNSRWPKFGRWMVRTSF